MVIRFRFSARRVVARARPPASCPSRGGRRVRLMLRSRVFVASDIEEVTETQTHRELAGLYKV